MSKADFVHYICYSNLFKFEINMDPLFCEVREVLSCVIIVRLKLESLVCVKLILLNWLRVFLGVAAIIVLAEWLNELKVVKWSEHYQEYFRICVRNIVMLTRMWCGMHNFKFWVLWMKADLLYLGFEL